jgi:hypothetical protein
VIVEGEFKDVIALMFCVTIQSRHSVVVSDRKHDKISFKENFRIRIRCHEN